MRRPGWRRRLAGLFAWLADDATRSFSFRSPAWSTTGLPCPPLALLVLNDYHLVRAQAVQDAVAFLLEHLPRALHLVIASREDPPLPPAAGSTSLLHLPVDAPTPPRRQADDQTVTRQGGNR